MLLLFNIAVFVLKRDIKLQPTNVYMLHIITDTCSLVGFHQAEPGMFDSVLSLFLLLLL